MKKIISILLATITLACFIACKKNTEETTPEEKYDVVTKSDIPSTPTFSAGKEIICKLGETLEQYVFTNETSASATHT